MTKLKLFQTIKGHTKAMEHVDKEIVLIRVNGITRDRNLYNGGKDAARM